MDTILINVHPDVLARAAFVDRPRCLTDLFRAIDLIDEKISVSKERQAVQPAAWRQNRSIGEPRDVPPNGPAVTGEAWNRYY